MKALSNKLEVIHRDYNTLCDFIHVKEIWDGGLLEYSDTHFEKLEWAIFDHLDEQQKEKYNESVEMLTYLIKIALSKLEKQAKTA